MRWPTPQEKYFSFSGGLDQVSPPITIKPGVARNSRNFEIGVNGGYSRVRGYERFDGRARPSDAVYHSLAVTVTGSAALGNTITGATSGATGVIVAMVSGTWYLTKVVGTFQASETINISGAPVATADAANSVGGASTLALNATYLNLAADQYRADIAVVPGSGSILGVWQYAGAVYAWRNNAGGTAAVMHKATTSGWTAITLLYEVSFTVGNVATPVDGETLTQGGVTSTVRRVATRTGAWSGSAAGIFVINAPSGGNFAAGAATLSGGATVTLSGVQTAIAFAPGGRFECVNYNFGGSANTTRMYGCDGVNRAFDFDGTVLTPIATGMTTDAPKHIIAHKKHLFLSFGGSIQHSSIGAPYTWSPVTGAAEIGVGDTCNGFRVLPGSQDTAALAIYNRNSTFVLYGTSSADWNLVTYSDEAGAIEWTLQAMSQIITLDDRGITLLSTTSAFGNFKDSTISRAIDPTLRDLRGTAIASCVVREKNQYRVFFSGGDAIYLTFADNKIAGLMLITLPNPVTCICSQEAANGVEEIYYGSTDGYVYQMEKGTSFDGEAIDAHIELAYNHFDSPRLLKQWRKAMIEVSGSSYCEFSFAYLLGYASVEVSQPNTATVTNNLSATSWDSFTWDRFWWDGATLVPAELDLEGLAENISLIFASNSDEYESFTLNGAIVQFVPRRPMR